MSKILSRIARFFSNRTLAGVDKAGNLYFTRTEEIDGIIKEKRWVVFKGEEDPTSIPVEWISWLNGQRKVAPTPEEMAELEARRERIRLNVARLKEEEQKKLKDGSALRSMSLGKVGGPNLQSFIRQFPASSEGDKVAATVGETENLRTSKDREKQANSEPGSSEPTGSGASFKPGAWQPPT